MTAIQNEAYSPTIGSTPAIIENAIASGIKAKEQQYLLKYLLLPLKTILF